MRMMKRRGLELTFGMIIIAILATIVLIISILLLTRGVKTYSSTEKSLTSCGSGVLSSYQCVDNPQPGDECLTIGCPQHQHCCKKTAS